jgi:predicted ABC-type ATPase
MLGEIRSFAKRRVSFAFETTLSGRSHLTLLRKLKAEGYDINFFFLWLKSGSWAIKSQRTSFKRRT